jgi:hypothetical protein
MVVVQQLLATITLECHHEMISDINLYVYYVMPGSYVVDTDSSDRFN